MKKDLNEKSTSKRGGQREGAGRKPIGEKPKEGAYFKLDAAVKEKLALLSKDSGFNRTEVVEYLINKAKKIPKKTD